MTHIELLGSMMTWQEAHNFVQGVINLIDDASWFKSLYITNFQNNTYFYMSHFYAELDLILGTLSATNVFLWLFKNIVISTATFKRTIIELDYVQYLGVAIFLPCSIKCMFCTESWNVNENVFVY